MSWGSLFLLMSSSISATSVAFRIDSAEVGYSRGDLVAVGRPPMPIDHGSAAGLDEGSGRLSKRSPLTLFVIGIWCVAGKLITRKGYQIRH